MNGEDINWIGNHEWKTVPIWSYG